MPNMPYMPNGAPVTGGNPQMPCWQPWPAPAGKPLQPSMPAPPPPLASGQQRPIVRGAMPDAPPAPPPPAPRVVLPSPEALGIKISSATPAAGTAPTAVDWNQVHARMEKLGVVHLQRDCLAQGGVRVILSLPSHSAEATGDTEAAAVLLALERAEHMITSQR
jgi:hypothetical protein